MAGGTGLKADAVALAVDAPALRTLAEDALRAGGIAFSGPEAVGSADLVVVDASQDVAWQMAVLRARTRLDAAILVLVAPTESSSAKASPDVTTSALGAGAFACVRAPFSAEELLDLARGALVAGVAEEELADLSRTVDLETHLGAIGRVGAGITHEIANPLSVAMTNLDVLREECDDIVATLRGLTTTQPDLLPARLESASARLRALDQDDGLGGMIGEIAEAHERLRAVLDETRGLAGKGLKASPEPLDLLPLARDVTNAVGASLAGVAVEVMGEPVVAEADRMLLRRIVESLTTNAAEAAKSRASPRVRLHVYAEDGLAVISIRDNGPGIPRELHERIFEPFYTTRRGRGGMGLGLALCREHAVRMGAKLTLWSVPGRGTCFRVRLPLARRS